MVNFALVHGYSDVATGVWGKYPPHFCQDGARDFLKIDEKLDVGRE